VFEGGGFGVGLTVNQVGLLSDAPGGPVVPADPAWHPTRLSELMPVAARSDAELAEEVRRANIADSRLWAYRLELIVQLAYRRRDDRDRPPGTPGAASHSWAGTSPLPEGLSEFLADEVAMIGNCSRSEATTLIAVGWTLIHRLPDTWAALADGELNWSRARAFAQEIGRYGLDLDQHVVRMIEAVVLPQAAELAVARLRSLIRAEVLRHDAEAAEQRRRRARRPPTSSSAGPRSTACPRSSPSCRNRSPRRCSARWTGTPARPRSMVTSGRSAGSGPR
jgi:hypothetical protein